MKIGFIPIDNRPVCYTLPKLTGEINSKIEICIPDRKLLGDLKKTADINEIFNWLKSLQNLDYLIISLDTLIWGGLIPSRRSNETLFEIEKRLDKLKTLLKEKRCKIYAFSSIMRISNNNINEEEKLYWKDWGKKIFEYSYLTDKNGQSPQTDIPQMILNDYLETRRRNFEINKIYLNWQKEGLFDTLVFSKDDCAEYGFNVQEAKELEMMGGFVKTGADEIPLSLLARANTDYKPAFTVASGLNSISDDKKIKIFPVFTEPEYKNLISNYEDVSVEKSIIGQIELAGCELSENYNNADIILIVNNFKKNQGEIVMKIPTEKFQSDIEIPQKPFMIADVRFANGADNNFVEKLFKKIDFQNLINNPYFLGYSAWNTSANTVGSLIAGGIAKFSDKNFKIENFKKLQMTRFLDDWGYQANVRQMLKSPDVTELSKQMKIFENKLGISEIQSYNFPWNRLFEVEVEFS